MIMDLQNTYEVTPDIGKMLVGLWWDPNEQSRSVLDGVKAHNLDLSCAVIGEGGSVIDLITPQDTKRDQYKTQIYHRGDNLTGASDFEDEEISINFDALDDSIKALAFVISVHDDIRFSEVINGKCTFSNGMTLEPFLEADFESISDDAGIPVVANSRHNFLACMKRNDDGSWLLTHTNQNMPVLDVANVEDTVRELKVL